MKGVFDEQSNPILLKGIIGLGYINLGTNFSCLIH